ncbi:hypothetical protein QIS74_05640 [Colletotrichum tabaci]|uniref:Uncharacterized protein n=1 Tax=Colletotrichum tabaci TaxID=1209068 RepID=A0AAV9TFQ6_9PEZI
MRFFALTAVTLVSIASADFTSYCCHGLRPLTTGDIAWALDAKNGRTAEMGIAGGAVYSSQVGMCTFNGTQPMACGKYITSARTSDRAGTRLKNGFLFCDDTSYMKTNHWDCPF